MTAPKIIERLAADLKANPRNARTHSDGQVERIQGLFEKFGFTQPVLVDESGLIFAGHGRNLAALKTYREGGTLRYPGGAPIRKGHVPTLDCSAWSEDERRAYMLADNQVAQQAGWDLDILTSELEALTAIEFDLATIGFDDGAMADIQSLIDPPEGRANREPGSSQQDSTFQHQDQFGVIVICRDEAEQQAVFERLRDEGLTVKVVVV